MQTPKQIAILTIIRVRCFQSSRLKSLPPPAYLVSLPRFFLRCPTNNLRWGTGEPSATEKLSYAGQKMEREGCRHKYCPETTFTGRILSPLRPEPRNPTRVSLRVRLRHKF